MIRLFLRLFSVDDWQPTGYSVRYAGHTNAIAPRRDDTTHALALKRLEAREGSNTVRGESR